MNNRVVPRLHMGGKCRLVYGPHTNPTTNSIEGGVVHSSPVQ
jgi:hypothetical protein